MICHPLFISGLVLCDTVARTDLIELICMPRVITESTLMELIDYALLDLSPTQHEERTTQLFEFLTEPRIMSCLWKPGLTTAHCLVLNKIAHLAIDLQRSIEKIFELREEPLKDLRAMMSVSDECAIDLILTILKTNPSSQWAFEFLHRGLRLFESLSTSACSTPPCLNILEICRLSLDPLARVGHEELANIMEGAYFPRITDSFGKAQHQWMTALIMSSIKPLRTKTVHDEELHRLHSLALVVEKYVTTICHNDARNESSPEELNRDEQLQSCCRHFVEVLKLASLRSQGYLKVSLQSIAEDLELEILRIKTST